MRRHVKRYLVAYLQGELPPHLARRVREHIQHCDACYAALQREGERERVLAEQFAGFGAPYPAQLARVKASVLAAVLPPSTPPPTRRLLPGMGVLLALGLMIVLLAPVVMTPRLASLVNVPDQHGPNVLAATALASRTDFPAQLVVSPTAVAQRALLQGDDAATAPPALDPPPAPIAEATPGR